MDKLVSILIAAVVVIAALAPAAYTYASLA